MAATVENPGGLHSVVRGEISAVETYDQALEKMPSGQTASELRRIQTEHREALTELKAHLKTQGAAAPTSSGLWGGWAKFVEGAAQTFGAANALRALKQGEEHGLNQYEAALKDSDVGEECKSLIRTKLLPQTQAHCSALDRLIEVQ